MISDDLSEYVKILNVNLSEELRRPEFSLGKYCYLVAIVCPATELHVTMLVVEGEPSDVYLACALEYARGHVQATAVVSDHHVGLVRPVKTFVSTMYQYKFCLSYNTFHNP